MTILTKNFAELKERFEDNVSTRKTDERLRFRNCLFHKYTGREGPEYVETMYGIPVILQVLAEDIFNDMPFSETVTAFTAFFDAVECDGKDLSRIVWQFFAAEFYEYAALLKGKDLYAVNRVIAGMDLLAAGEKWLDAADVANEAYSVSWDDSGAFGPGITFEHFITLAAACAARAAAYATNHVQHAACDVVYATSYAADGAARLAVADGFAGDYAASRLRQRDTLLRLIKEAPVVENAA